MSDITMPYPLRLSQTRLDLPGLFNAELARSDAMTGLVDAGRALWPRFATFYRGLARLPRKTRRALQRRWRRSLGGIALLCALGQVPAALADQIDVGVNGCTLVDAITAANTNEPMGGCPAGSGADTISLPAGIPQLLTAANYYFYGDNGLPVVRSAIVIDGNGSTIARDPQAPEFRILAVDPAGDLVLQETIVTGGVISTSSGGGIFNGGTLTLTNSTVLSSSTVSGGSATGSGGGIFNSSSGTLTLSSSTVSGNSAAGSGGGIFNSYSGTLTLTNSTVSGNSAGYGGGVKNYGTLTLSSSTVSGNSAAASGGGVYSFGTLALTNSTVSGNSAGFRGGGVHNDGTSTLTNSTVSGNSAGSRGGGVHNDGTLTLTNSIVSGNHNNGTLTLTNSTVSGNTASSQGPEVYNYDGAEGTGTVNAGDFNLFGYDGSSGVTGFTPGVTDIVPSVPLRAILDPALADNGGPTRTHALVTGSPAIDAIPAASCATIGDQRGVTRPQDGGGEDTNADCDIGAFELQLPPFPTITITTSPTKLLPSEATPVEQNPKVQCLGSDCRVRIKCDGSTEPCNTRVDVFIRASALRIGEGGATRARRRIRFAVAVANIPPGETANVPLRLTKRGRRIVRTGLNRRLRGVMEIRNSIGPVQTVRIRLRLRQ